MIFFKSSGNELKVFRFIANINVAVPNLSPPSISTEKSVSSAIFRGIATSNGISAPSIAFFDSACGSDGTGIPTGSAPQLSTIHAPVREGDRSFKPFKSSKDLTVFETVWSALPACTWINNGLIFFRSSPISSIMSCIAKLVALASPL